MVLIYMHAIFSGFYCSIETSRTIRVDARSYCIRIAAVSQHVLVCITRKVTRPAKWHGFSFGIGIYLAVVWMVEVDVISSYGIGVALISV